MGARRKPGLSREETFVAWLADVPTNDFAQNLVCCSIDILLKFGWRHIATRKGLNAHNAHPAKSTSRYFGKSTGYSMSLKRTALLDLIALLSVNMVCLAPAITGRIPKIEYIFIINCAGLIGTALHSALLWLHQNEKIYNERSLYYYIKIFTLCWIALLVFVICIDIFSSFLLEKSFPTFVFPAVIFLLAPFYSRLLSRS